MAHPCSVHLKFLDAYRGSVPLLKTNDPPPLCHVPPFLYRANTPNIPTRCVIDFQWRSTASHTRGKFIDDRAPPFDSNSIQWTRISTITHIDTQTFPFTGIEREREKQERIECYVAVSANIFDALKLKAVSSKSGLFDA